MQRNSGCNACTLRITCSRNALLREPMCTSVICTNRKGPVKRLESKVTFLTTVISANRIPTKEMVMDIPSTITAADQTSTRPSSTANSKTSRVINKIGLRPSKKSATCRKPLASGRLTSRSNHRLTTWLDAIGISSKAVTSGLRSSQSHNRNTG